MIDFYSRSAILMIPDEMISQLDVDIINLLTQGCQTIGFLRRSNHDLKETELGFCEISPNPMYFFTICRIIRFDRSMLSSFMGQCNCIDLGHLCLFRSTEAGTLILHWRRTRKRSFDLNKKQNSLELRNHKGPFSASLKV
jgi:hypothetical protein